MILINPRGEAMPCHAAAVIPGRVFDNVRERSLSWIWTKSSAFQRPPSRIARMRALRRSVMEFWETLGTNSEIF